MQLYGQGSTARIRQTHHIDTVIIPNLGFPKQTQNYKYHTRILKNVYIRYPYEYYQNKFLRNFNETYGKNNNYI